MLARVVTSFIEPTDKSLEVFLEDKDQAQGFQDEEKSESFPHYA